MSPSPALSFAIEAAAELNAALVQQIGWNKAHFDITVDLADGSSTAYQLIVEDTKNYLSVMEKEPLVLPGCCPQRHINVNGTFCLGWYKHEEMEVSSVEAAKAWWSKLQKFLMLQRRAKVKRKWPGQEWAHGTAAEYQLRAEQAAQALGPDFVRDLELGNFYINRIEKSGPRGALLKVFRNNSYMCSIWEQSKMVANKRQPCLCRTVPYRKPKRMRSCRDHASQIMFLGIAINDKKIAEDRFWDAMKSQICCGTMDSCPLKTH